MVLLPGNASIYSYLYWLILYNEQLCIHKDEAIRIFIKVHENIKFNHHSLDNLLWNTEFFYFSLLCTMNQIKLISLTSRKLLSYAWWLIWYYIREKLANHEGLNHCIQEAFSCIIVCFLFDLSFKLQIDVISLEEGRISFYQHPNFGKRGCVIMNGFNFT